MTMGGAAALCGAVRSTDPNPRGDRRGLRRHPTPYSVVFFL
jgi:hypothetical protein